MIKDYGTWRSWASIMERQTQEQIERTSLMPFIYPYVAAMPDAHWGVGCSVGSVVPTVEALMPACVGVDIGCGMAAARTSLTASDLTPANRADIRRAIEAAVPSSKGGYNQKIYDPGTEERLSELEGMHGYKAARAVAGNWEYQLGSLGGGNHFIEVSQDEMGRVWIFLHSGSRGVGNKLAVKHIRVAKQVCAAAHVSLPDQDLAYLTEGTEEFNAYREELLWAQHFALLNREEMLGRVAQVIGKVVGHPVSLWDTVRCHHNYTELTLIGDRVVWLTRKGAIDAGFGKRGLIPGSMGDLSYIVTGKGNADGLFSAPHGAGRMFGRKHARETLHMDDFRAAMDGIEWRDDEALLDEAPAAYKPIETVMSDAADLVTIQHTLSQLVNVKGN